MISSTDAHTLTITLTGDTWRPGVGLGGTLSTQLLNDRLHIEGEVGAQTTGTVNAEDFQIQDLTVSFDLTEDGGIQLTGHSRQNVSLTNAIEGEAVQGVGIRFKWAFDQWGARKNR